MKNTVHVQNGGNCALGGLEQDKALLSAGVKRAGAELISSGFDISEDIGVLAGFAQRAEVAGDGGCSLGAITWKRAKFCGR